MSIRIDIELTSSGPDGSWTWRAAGAKQPRGVLDGSILPAGAAVGDQLKVETDHDVDGIRVLSVVPAKGKAARTDLLELLPSEVAFEPVIQQRVKGGRDDDRGPRRPRRDGPDRGDRRGPRDGAPRGDRGGPGADNRSDRGGAARPDRAGGRGDGPPRGAERSDADRRTDRSADDRRRHRPHFTPPPEVPQRPKPKRLRPGKQHRTEVLAALPEEQRPIAELAQQGMAAVRQRLREDNARMRAEGKPEMPEVSVMKMAEELLPRMRVADWLDRAEAAERQLEHLDLRDLRSVVAASDDPVVARDESTREIAVRLKAALVTKQDEELALWLTDVEVALDVGRVVRALRLSSVPPKAGVRFPPALATRLAEATTASLQPADGPDRWSAVLEAAAFSPVRALVAPTAAPEQRSDELVATVRRLGPLLPQVAALFEIEVPKGAPVPKPLRPTARKPEPKKQPAKPPRVAPDRPSGPAREPGDGAAPAVAGSSEPATDDSATDDPATDDSATAADDAPATTPPDADATPTAVEADPAATAPGAEALAADEAQAPADEPAAAVPSSDAVATPTPDEPAATDHEPPAAVEASSAPEQPAVAESPVVETAAADEPAAPASEEPVVAEPAAPASDEPADVPAAPVEPAAEADHDAGGPALTTEDLDLRRLGQLNRAP